MRIPNLYIINTGSPAVVTLSIAGGNYPIVNIYGSFISGTFDYILLSGSNISIATFIQSGNNLVLDSNGEGSINITSGSYTQGDPIILIIQSQSNQYIIGAYEAEVS